MLFRSSLTLIYRDATDLKNGTIHVSLSYILCFAVLSDRELISVGMRPSHQTPALLFADEIFADARDGNVHAIIALLEKDPSLLNKQEGHLQNTPLALACAFERVDVVSN